jgi:Flp pilus assembly pilin Flp
MNFKNCQGQSVAEYAVLLALIVIVVTAILIGVGHRSRDQLANVNAISGGLAGSSGSAPAGGVASAPGGSGHHSGGGQGSGNGSGRNDPDQAPSSLQ